MSDIQQLRSCCEPGRPSDAVAVSSCDFFEWSVDGSLQPVVGRILYSWSSVDHMDRVGMPRCIRMIFIREVYQCVVQHHQRALGDYQWHRLSQIPLLHRLRGHKLSSFMRMISPSKPAMHAQLVRARHSPQASILQRAVVQRPPEAQTALRIGVQERSILMRNH